ncbi:MAG TPA: transcriptional regulator [Planctomycetaceae bacterium]|nr:transcriptional regulator [Planctomycetaceae bacterium]
MPSSGIKPGLLRKMTVRRVLECLQEHGPLSRADLTRETGISAPTVSKAVADLLESGLLEEGMAPDHALGRPGKKLQLAQDTAQVIGVVLDVRECRVLSASLDGAIKSQAVVFSTPEDYPQLLEALTKAVKSLETEEVVTLGIGISTPGLIDEQNQRSLFSPNLQAINQRSPSADLTSATGLTAISVQESRALCLAERLYGNARGLDDFGMLDVTSGLGLGVFSGGTLLSGQSGLAGELGHVTMDPNGRQCGCGNRGCLETLATDTALAVTVSAAIGRALPIDQVIAEVQNGNIQIDEQLELVSEYLSVALAAAINLFNPSNLFVHGRLLTLNSNILKDVIARTSRRALAPSFEECDIQIAGSSKDQAAVASIVHHLTRSAGPRVAE